MHYPHPRYRKPKPLVWTASFSQALDKVATAKQTLATLR